MALTGNITLNAAGNSQQILFQNPGTVDSITFNGTGFVYPVASSFTLSQSDLILFLQYKINFYTALFVNFPILNSKFTQPLPFCNTQVDYTPGSNFLYYMQTSGMPVVSVYNILIHNGTLVSTFAARPATVTITPQEYLFSYQILIAYLNKCIQA